MENSNKLAFPILETDITSPIDLGLTKREYFAGLAMQGLCSNSEWAEITKETIAKEAVKLSDRLLKELEAKSKKKD